MEPRLLISIVIDNSAATQGDKFNNLKTSLYDFWKLLKTSDAKNIEIEIVTFDEFSPKVIKKFRDEDFDINQLEAFKMPFLGKAIDLSLKNLLDRQNFFVSHDVETYKPWLFVLTDAYSFDDVDQAVINLRSSLENSQILYMPFILSQKKIPENVENLAKAKRFMRIKDNAYESFFNWFFSMAEKRAKTPVGTPVKFDRAGFEGWAVL